MEATETPASLALDLGVSQKRIRDVLRDVYGTLPPGTSRWVLTEEMIAVVRDRMSGVSAAEWALEPGDTVRRRAIHDTYRGQQQGGISTPRSLGEVLIFTSPKQGAKYGYDRYEGLREDGTYSYTGEGQLGDMEWVRGNLAILRAGQEGSPIRLLVTDGTAATYVGSFTTADPAYRWETIPDVNGDDRAAIIFNLTPLEAESALLPAYGGGRSRDGSAATAHFGQAEANEVNAVESEWTVPEWSDVLVEPSDQVQVREGVVSRIEMKLQADFGRWLLSEGATPKRLSLAADGTRITPDFYVPSKGWIVEAKKSSGRIYVRGAIGQVLDYVHVARQSGYEVVPAILVPGRPQERLVALLRELEIKLIYRESNDGFVVAV